MLKSTMLDMQLLINECILRLAINENVTQTDI